MHMLNEAVWWSPRVAWCALRYWTTGVPVHRTDERGVDVVFPELPEPCGDDVQTPEMGVGPAFHRRYRACITAGELSPDEMMHRLVREPNCVVPREAAVFDRRVQDAALRPAEDLVVRMPGPWDGPVRVLHIDRCSFRLVTLAGHLEAGQIEFRARPRGEDVVFEIESWARSGDWLADLLYDKLVLLQEMQTYLWSHYCAGVCTLSRGRMRAGVDVYTARAKA